ncbi:MAG: hypothetical protein AAF667_08180 [Pseudomonadota bacterium]
MNRTELIVATTIVLFVAFAAGWFASWLVQRFTRVSRADMGELDNLAQQLHDAEEARDRAILKAEEVEDGLKRRLTQTEAELSATMEGLREARREAEDLRARLSENEAG